MSRPWAAAALLVLGGCSLFDPCRDLRCGACPPPFELRVTDRSSGAAVPGVQVTGAEVSCGEAGGYTSCSPIGGGGAGTFHLTVSAPGFVSTDVTVNVGEVDTTGQCCACGYQPQQVVIELVGL
ncbi:MAG: carboxypeptidase-like regulatory domain-containing protein [Myxococcota bacterium]|nr:carboxypeptidase-like regulatory domain-containing protein [Myxococcota bacterium]